MMQRFGMMIRLKPGSEESYKRYHAAVWPECLSMIHECNIRNYSLYLKDGILFSYFEYHGSDMKGDWGKMAAHAKTQDWWAIMQPMQEPVPTRKEEERAAWYRNAKFGMFIHWGPYSLASVEASWPIMRPAAGGITEAEYRELPKRFNPTNFNPHAFVDLARAAGQ